VRWSAVSFYVRVDWFRLVSFNYAVHVIFGGHYLDHVTLLFCSHIWAKQCKLYLVVCKGMARQACLTYHNYKMCSLASNRIITITKKQWITNLTCSIETGIMLKNFTLQNINTVSSITWIRSQQDHNHNHVPYQNT